MATRTLMTATGTLLALVALTPSQAATAVDPVIRGEGSLGWIFDAVGLREPCWETGSKVSFAEPLILVGPGTGNGDLYIGRKGNAFGTFSFLGEASNLYQYRIEDGIAYDYADCDDPPTLVCDQLPVEFRCKYQGLPAVPAT